MIPTDSRAPNSANSGSKLLDTAPLTNTIFGDVVGSNECVGSIPTMKASVGLNSPVPLSLW